MNSFDKRYSHTFDDWDEKKAYLDSLNSEVEIPDNIFFKEDNDDLQNEVNQYILIAANDGASVFRNIKNYIETNQYIQDNPEKFKKCVEKISELTDSIEKFIDEYEL